MKNKSQFFIFIKKYEIIFASIFILVAVLFLVKTFALSNFYRAGEILVEQERIQKKIQDLRTKDNQLTSLDYTKFKEIYAKIDRILPEEKDYVSLFGTFDELERKTGVTIVSTDFQLGAVSTVSAKLTKHKTSQAFVVPLSVSLSGDLYSLKNFIQALNTLERRLIIIENLNWEVKKDGGVHAVISGKAFFYPSATTLVKIETPLPKINKENQEIIDQLASLPSTFEEKFEELLEERGEIKVGKENLFN